jgi:hypothetical protein
MMDRAENSAHGTAHAIAHAIAQEAARWVAEHGLDYASAKHKAARALDIRRPTMPSDEALEDALREHIELFCAETQPAELLRLRELALHWMQRLQTHRPHLAGAVWRGTATRHSAVWIDLYAEDPKMLPIELLNMGLQADVDETEQRGHSATVLTVYSPWPASAGFEQPTPVHLRVQDIDALRGALKPDSQGRAWRGSFSALQNLLARPADTSEGRA